MKTLLTPGHSTNGSVFNYSPTMQRSATSMNSLSSYLEKEDVVEEEECSNKDSSCIQNKDEHSQIKTTLSSTGKYNLVFQVYQGNSVQQK